MPLFCSGVQISATTVRRRLLEVGRKARKPLKKQLLTQKIKQKRLAWAKKYKTWSFEEWKNVLFSDETHFLCRDDTASMLELVKERS